MPEFKPLLALALALYAAGAALGLAAEPAPRRSGLLRPASRLAACAGAALNLWAVGGLGLAEGRAPLANMGETLAALGLGLFVFFVLAEIRPGLGASGLDLLLGAGALAGALFLADRPRPLMPALQSWFFFPHVAVYVLGYAALFKAGILAVGGLAAGEEGERWGGAADRAVRLGYPFLTAGMLLGALWGKYAWGDYWNWDPKELWALVTWGIYTFYLHLPAAGIEIGPAGRALFLAGGAAAVLFTLLGVSFLLPGLHSYG